MQPDRAPDAPPHAPSAPELDAHADTPPLDLPSLDVPPALPPSLAPDTWAAAADRHAAEVHDLLARVRARRLREGKDPVYDFLFTYYSFKPSKLAQWSPGAGVLLEGADPAAFRDRHGFAADARGAWVDHTPLCGKRSGGIRFIIKLLEGSQRRPPFFGCYGMHEWAMVYKLDPEDIRHQGVPLRMDSATLAAFVERQPIICAHYDAFRFFTPDARPLNRVQPTFAQMADLEQPGCLHTNMDLYRWAYKFYPWIGSDLLLTTFKLAAQARLLDMRASPYDLRAHGLSPIPIETPEGRLAYQAAQRHLWAQGAPLRAALLVAYQRLHALTSTASDQRQRLDT